MNILPQLIEINLGFPDFRYKETKIEKLSFPYVKVLLGALPAHIKNVGIGGSPLRFEWWREFVYFLSNMEKNITLVEKVSQIDDLRVKFIKTTKIKLFLEIEDINEIKKACSLKNNCDKFLVSLEKIYENNSFFNSLKRTKIPFGIETITWQIDDVETRRIKQFLSHLGNVNIRCEIMENKVIGLGLDGNFYPCVALQFSEFKLGNIFNDNFDKILRNYIKFKKKLKCQYCCQARSWSKYKSLNQDPLCHHRC
jgi:radical SAM protein with 4Fe4S-binding SPASM domain